MKRVFVLLILSIVLFSQARAQKFGHVDADFILKQMTSYQTAQREIKEEADKWNQDIQEKKSEVDKMKEDFRAEELLLTDDMKEERKEEIQKQEQEVLELQSKYFGPNGLYFSRRNELIRPAQEELYEAVQKVARKNKLQYIFTNTEGLTILYAEIRHDYTEEVLEELGLGQEEENPENKN